MGSNDLDTALAELAAIDRKVLGTLLVSMLRHHDRVRDREWMSAEFVSATALAMDLDDAPAPQDGLDSVQEYASANVDRMMQVAIGVFVRVANEMQQRASFDYDDAVECAMRAIGRDTNDR